MPESWVFVPVTGSVHTSRQAAVPTGVLPLLPTCCSPKPAWATEHCSECFTLPTPTPALVKLQAQTQLQKTPTRETKGDTLLGRSPSHLGRELQALRSNSMSHGMRTLWGIQPYSQREQERKHPQEDLCGFHELPCLWGIVSEALLFCCPQGRSPYRQLWNIVRDRNQ